MASPIILIPYNLGYLPQKLLFQSAKWYKYCMNIATIRGLSDELRKLSSKRDIVQLLSSSATRRGLAPTKLPSLVQIENIAQTDRSRAAQIANNVRGFLHNKAKPK